jgi:hypothetical protein
MQIAIALRRGYPHITQLNSIVHERLDYTQRLLQHGILSPVCKELLMPSGQAEMEKKSVDIHALSGVFVAYACAIAVGVFVYFIEVVYARVYGIEKQQHTTRDITALSPMIDFIDDEQIYAQYCVLLRMIEHKRRQIES